MISQMSCYRWLSKITIENQTYDQEVEGLTPGQVAMKWLILAWMTDCLRTLTGKPSSYITNNKVNSALYPSVAGKSTTSLSGLG